ncbi:MAG: hypothetical protein R2776_06030 [Flavobacteriaceae bacterium]|nr:hypothetical protein [Flavobacteriaceae bacterium]
MNKLFFIIILALSITACKEKVTEPAGPTQMEQVIAIHDELMPKMGTVGELIAKLEASMDSTQVDSMKLTAIQNLKGTNQEMMTWMMDFGNAFDSAEVLDGKELSEEKIKTLTGFQESVNNLKSSMEAAIAHAEKLLSN